MTLCLLRLGRCRGRCGTTPRGHRRAPALLHAALPHAGTRGSGPTLHHPAVPCIASAATATTLDPASLLRHPTAHGAELFGSQDGAELVFLLPLGRLTPVADVAECVAVAILDGPQLGALLGAELGHLLTFHPGLLRGARRVLGNHRRNEAGGHEGEEGAECHWVLHVERLCRVGTEMTRLVPRR